MSPQPPTLIPSEGCSWGRIWAGLPSFLLFALLVVPPFAGTIALYRAALFMLVGHTVVELAIRRPKLDSSVRIIVALAAAFVIWSLVSALLGVDPKYNRRAWRSEHLYVGLLFAAVLLNPCGYRLDLVLWGGCLSILLITLGVAVDQWLMTPLAHTMLAQLRLWKVAYLKGFSTDITWITNHLVLIFWLAPVTLLLRKPREPLFWMGALAAAAGIWLVLQTFQAMVFVVIAATVLAFLLIGLGRRWPSRFPWLLAATGAVLIAAVGYRDLVLYPDKKISEGLVQFAATGKTENLHLQSRLNGIRWAAAKSIEAPFFGFGPGREVLRKVEPQTFNITENEIPDFSKHPPLGHLHNQYADLLVRTGIAGLAIYLALLIAIFWAGIRSKPWTVDWKIEPGAALRLGALVASGLALFRLLTETYPASSVGVQYWLLLAFAALPASAWKTIRSSCKPLQ